MTIRRRSLVVGVIVCFFLILYSTAKLNSQLLIQYVVEQTLIQKAPSGTQPDEIRRRFRKLLASVPNKRERTNLLFQISRDLEKVQELTPEAFDVLLEPERREISNGR
ncbi:MAG: hypothetical protein P8Z37_13815 [Acidobacteriota bacterium]